MNTRLLPRRSRMEALLSLFLFILTVFFSRETRNFPCPNRESGQPVFQPALATAGWEAGAMKTFLSCLDALRESGDRKMARLLSEGKNRGEIPLWLAFHGINVLSSCRPGAILFTGGLRDTLASWYQQYVHSFRRDVTVIPIGLLDRGWCLETFNLIQGPHVKPAFWKILQERDLGGGYSQSHYSSESMETLEDIIESNWPDRPVQFSLDCDHEWLYERRGMLQPCGLTCVLAPASDNLKLQAACRTGGKGGSIHQFSPPCSSGNALAGRFREAPSVNRDFEMRLLDSQQMACIALACRQDPRGMKSTLFDYLTCYRYMACTSLRQGMTERSHALMRFMNRLFAGNLPMALDMI